MKKRLNLLALSITLTATAFAAPVKDNTLEGKITDWPAGKTGEMQLRVLDYVTDKPDVVIATTPIDADGNFKFKLPDAKALAKVLSAKDTSYSYAGLCSGSLTLDKAAQMNLFDLIAVQDGKVLGNARFNTSRLQWPWLADNFKFQTLAFSTADTAVDGAASCDLQSSPNYDQNGSRMRVETTAKLNAGWNALSGTDSGSKTIFTDEAMPANAFWHVLSGYGGIGMQPQVTDDKKNVRIAALQEGMPAQAAGLQVGDLVLAIDDYKVDPNDLGTAAAHVRGDENTTVVITVQRGGETLKIPVKRAFIPRK